VARPIPREGGGNGRKDPNYPGADKQTADEDEIRKSKKSGTGKVEEGAKWKRDISNEVVAMFCDRQGGKKEREGRGDSKEARGKYFGIFVRGFGDEEQQQEEEEEEEEEEENEI